MLHGVGVRDKPLVRINPSITVEELAARSFDEGAGYLVSDMFDDRSRPNSRTFIGATSAARSASRRLTSS